MHIEYDEEDTRKSVIIYPKHRGQVTWTTRFQEELIQRLTIRDICDLVFVVDMANLSTHQKKSLILFLTWTLKTHSTLVMVWCIGNAGMILQRTIVGILRLYMKYLYITLGTQSIQRMELRTLISSIKNLNCYTHQEERCDHPTDHNWCENDCNRILCWRNVG